MWREQFLICGKDDQTESPMTAWLRAHSEFYPALTSGTNSP
jgi:hypothetical protein